MHIAILDTSIYIGHWERHKRREFQNDVLIALTARRYEATVVTANLSDFALLAQARQIQILGAK